MESAGNTQNSCSMTAMELLELLGSTSLLNEVHDIADVENYITTNGDIDKESGDTRKGLAFWFRRQLKSEDVDPSSTSHTQRSIAILVMLKSHVNVRKFTDDLATQLSTFIGEYNQDSISSNPVYYVYFTPIPAPEESLISRSHAAVFPQNPAELLMYLRETGVWEEVSNAYWEMMELMALDPLLVLDDNQLKRCCLIFRFSSMYTSSLLHDIYERVLFNQNQGV